MKKNQRCRWRMMMGVDQSRTVYAVSASQYHSDVPSEMAM